MRQAGRSLPEYRAVRQRHSILDICRSPELAAEVTLQPVRRLGVDAAILFSDIVVPLQAMGVELDIRPGIGPAIYEPIRSAADVDRLLPLEVDTALGFVLDTIRLLTGETDVALIGFAGAPFTLASYLIEGGPSRTHARTKAFMYSQPGAWQRLMDGLGGAIRDYLRSQIGAGVHAVQLFDSWAGWLSPDDYRTYVLPAVRRLFAAVEDEVPRIYFGVGTSELLRDMATASAEVMGIDWRVPLDEARRRVGPSKAVQGNLDPSVCLAPWEVVRAKAADVLRRGGGRGHVFNLGHGVLPDTDPDVLARVVDFVHSWSRGD
jgi:uroporphyrinogen decarboxylase